MPLRSAAFLKMPRKSWKIHFVASIWLVDWLTTAPGCSGDGESHRCGAPSSLTWRRESQEESHGWRQLSWLESTVWVPFQIDWEAAACLVIQVLPWSAQLPSPRPPTWSTMKASGRLPAALALACSALRQPSEWKRKSNGLKTGEPQHLLHFCSSLVDCVMLKKIKQSLTDGDGRCFGGIPDFSVSKISLKSLEPLPGG